MNKEYINLVSYLGGKSRVLNWLIPLFPKGNFHFVDAMCGSASVSLNVQYPLVTINDVNRDVINLFRVLRENYDDFMRKLYFTPFSRKELYDIIDDSDPDVDDVEKARRFFVKCQIGFGANASQNNHRGSAIECLIKGKSKYYGVKNWNKKLEKLPLIVNKLRHFQIESKNALDLFDWVNKPGNIVYFDPPYVAEKRGSTKYNHEVTGQFHAELAEKMKNANCFVAVSGYESEIYNDLFNDFFITKSPENKINMGFKKVRECLWTNYDPKKVNGILELDFDEK